jgi:hypothetical protein
MEVPTDVQKLIEQLLTESAAQKERFAALELLPRQPLHPARVNSPQHHSTGDGHPRISDNVPVHLGSYKLST